jgi:hypothetical protein
VPAISFRTDLEKAQLITLADPLGHHLESADDVIEIGPGLQVRKRTPQTLPYNLDVTKLRGFEDGKLYRFECGPPSQQGRITGTGGIHRWNLALGQRRESMYQARASLQKLKYNLISVVQRSLPRPIL